MHVKKVFLMLFLLLYFVTLILVRYIIFGTTPFFCPLVFNLCSSARMVENVQMVPCSSLLHVSGVEREGNRGAGGGVGVVNEETFFPPTAAVPRNQGSAWVSFPSPTLV